MAAVEGEAVKVALKPAVRAAEKAALWMPAPAAPFTHSPGASVPIVDMPAWITAVTETLDCCPLVESAPVMVIVEVVAGVELEVVMVSVELPVPCTEGGLKLATTFEFVADALSETVPLKPLIACTFTVKVPVLPAAITTDVGATEMENSELPLLPGPPPVTSRRGDIVQPATASIKAIASHLKWTCTACPSLFSSHVSFCPPSPRHWTLSWIVFSRPVFAGPNAKTPAITLFLTRRAEEQVLL
jgi:hypothetical protein